MVRYMLTCWVARNWDIRFINMYFVVTFFPLFYYPLGKVGGSIDDEYVILS